jgi:microcystin-dependent protein
MPTNEPKEGLSTNPHQPGIIGNNSAGGIGLKGQSTGGIGVRGESTGGVAGFFDGDVTVTRNITVQDILLAGTQLDGQGLVAQLQALAKRIQDLESQVLPIGCIVAFAGPSTNIPKGWALCDGSALSSADMTYAGLYAMIGTCWGNGSSGGLGAVFSAVAAGPNKTDFNLPDLRGLFLRGVDGLANRDPDKDSNGRQQLTSGGNTGNQVGSMQNDEFRSHNHGGYTTDDDRPGVINNIRQPAQSLSENVNGYAKDPGWLAYTWQGNPFHQHMIPAGGGHETRPKNANVNYIIRVGE